MNKATFIDDVGYSNFVPIAQSLVGGVAYGLGTRQRKRRNKVREVQNAELLLRTAEENERVAKTILEKRKAKEEVNKAQEDLNKAKEEERKEIQNDLKPPKGEPIEEPKDEPKPKPKPQTLKWVLIGGGSLLVISLAIYLIRKRRAS
jgi:hypothetical protein